MRSVNSNVRARFCMKSFAIQSSYFDGVLHSGAFLNATFADRVRADTDVLLHVVRVAELHGVVSVELLKVIKRAPNNSTNFESFSRRSYPERLTVCTGPEIKPATFWLIARLHNCSAIWPPWLDTNAPHDSAQPHAVRAAASPVQTSCWCSAWADFLPLSWWLQSWNLGTAGGHWHLEVHQESLRKEKAYLSILYFIHYHTVFFVCLFFFTSRSLDRKSVV